jgi:hypothetical protein
MDASGEAREGVEVIGGLLLVAGCALLGVAFGVGHDWRVGVAVCSGLLGVFAIVCGFVVAADEQKAKRQ